MSELNTTMEMINTTDDTDPNAWIPLNASSKVWVYNSVCGEYAAKVAYHDLRSDKYIMSEGAYVFLENLAALIVPYIIIW